MKKLILSLYILFLATLSFSQGVTITIGGVSTTTTTPDSLVLNPTTGVVYKEGTIFYDTVTHTFIGYNDRSSVALNFGEEMWVRVVNKTGSQLNDGEVVYISGAQGNRPTVVVAKADALATSSGTIAVMTEDVINNDEGIATAFGIVRGFNTSGFTAGDELFLSPSTAGLIVNAKPTAPDFCIRIGWALNSAVNGDILVNININGTGAEHTYIDQDVTITGTPTFDNLTADSINVDRINIGSMLTLNGIEADSIIFLSEVTGNAGGPFDTITTSVIVGVDSLTISSKLISDYYFGDLYIDGDSTFATTLGADSTINDWNNNAQALFVNTTLTDSSVTLGSTGYGYYSVSYGNSFEHSVNSTEVHFFILINGVKQTKGESQRLVSTGGDLGDSGRSNIIFLLPNNAVVSLGYNCNKTGTLTIKHGYLSVIRIN